VRIFSLVAALAVATVVAAGCGPDKPFLGVPEWRDTNFEAFDANTPFKGVPRITAVKTIPYDNYVAFARQGRIVTKERRDDWLYFAVETPYLVSATNMMGDKQNVSVNVIERFRTEVPPAADSLFSAAPKSPWPDSVTKPAPKLQSLPQPAPIQPANPATSKTPGT